MRISDTALPPPGHCVTVLQTRNGHFHAEKTFSNKKALCLVRRSDITAAVIPANVLASRWFHQSRLASQRCEGANAVTRPSSANFRSGVFLLCALTRRLHPGYPDAFGSIGMLGCRGG